MKQKRSRQTHIDSHVATPQFEIWSIRTRPGSELLEIWQVPSPAQPEVTSPKRIARMSQRIWPVMEVRIRTLLMNHSIRLLGIEGETTKISLDEDLALKLALIFKTLAPMRQRFKIQTVYEGIDAMTHEEAAYWLGMALYRPNPRKVLAALRVMFA